MLVWRINLKKWKGIYEKIFWDQALVLWKKNLPGRGLTKFEKHSSRSVAVEDNLRRKMEVLREKSVPVPFVHKSHVECGGTSPRPPRLVSGN